MSVILPEFRNYPGDSGGQRRTRFPGRLFSSLCGYLCSKRVAIWVSGCVATKNMLIGLCVGEGKRDGLQEHYGGVVLVGGMLLRLLRLVQGVCSRDNERSPFMVDFC